MAKLDKTVHVPTDCPQCGQEWRFNSNDSGVSNFVHALRALNADGKRAYRVFLELDAPST